MPTRRESTNGTRNRILAALPGEEVGRLAPHLKEVDLPFKHTLYESGDKLETIQFVERGVVSLVVVLESGDVIEAGTVGNEGVVGVQGILGADTAPCRAICQVAGSGRRMSIDVLNDSSQFSTLLRLLLRYTNALISMFAQTAACNRAHSLEARMCRWLLMTLDRVGRNEFPLTQEFLAQMLGVRRPSVNLAGAVLQRAGLIRYTRGSITVLDRKGLETSSCECYERIRVEFERASELTPAKGGKPGVRRTI